MKPYGIRPKKSDGEVKKGSERAEGKRLASKEVLGFEPSKIEGCDESCPSCFPKEDLSKRAYYQDQLDECLEELQSLLEAKEGTPEYEKLMELSDVIEEIESRLYPEEC